MSPAEFQAIDQYMEVVGLFMVNLLVPVILALIAVWILVLIVSTVLYFKHVAPKLDEQLRPWIAEMQFRLILWLCDRARAARLRAETRRLEALLAVMQKAEPHFTPGADREAFLEWLNDTLARRIR